jgi:hypothetical protein
VGTAFALWVFWFGFGFLGKRLGKLFILGYANPNNSKTPTNPTNPKNPKNPKTLKTLKTLKT